MPYCHTHDHRVPYRDCTPQGLLRSRHYLDYFKAARVHALRDIGVRYRSLENEGVLMPVVDAEVYSPCPVRYDDLLTVWACFPDELSARITTWYAVSRGDAMDPGAVLASGRVTVCFISAETRRPIRPPGRVRRAFQGEEAVSSAPHSFEF